MSVEELRLLLRRRPVPPDAFALLSGAPDEAFVLERDGHHWVVFYSERGLRSEESRFTSEDEACSELYGRLARAFRFDDDPT